jgi:hypothetical protein
MAVPITIEKLRDLLGWPMLRPTDTLLPNYDGNLEILRDDKWIGMVYVSNGFVRIFGEPDMDYPKQEDPYSGGN